MLYVVCALYEEANPFITFFHLKKDTSNPLFQIFHGETVRLLISGVGPINCAIATTYFLTNCPPGTQDLILNIGICGSFDAEYHTGDIFLIHKITDFSNKHTYYPDILFKHPFMEEEITTFPQPVKNRDYSIYRGLVDMEASSFYEAATHFVSVHQLGVLKIVSDHLEPAQKIPFKPSELTNKLTPHLEKLVELHEWLPQIAATDNFPDSLISQLNVQLHGSVTMHHELRQLFYYYYLEHGSVESVLTSILDDTKTILNKKEGKQYFDKIRHLLIP